MGRTYSVRLDRTRTRTWGSNAPVAAVVICAPAWLRGASCMARASALLLGACAELYCTALQDMGEVGEPGRIAAVLKLPLSGSVLGATHGVSLMVDENGLHVRT